MRKLRTTFFTDITDFICVLFVSSIQKRKDRTSQWFSNDVLYKNGIAKRIMSGRKFHTILRYLHVCSLEDQPERNADNYDPAYKVEKFKDMLEERLKKLFVPGKNLSLDETLLHAFGIIKFKVRIVTKSARYGIKLYVVTDAETVFVTQIIIYTGKSTYNDKELEEYTGGVDLADQRRLHCNSTIMGGHCWWLKFFYLLDVGTANALILYNYAVEGNDDINLVEFKHKLIMGLVGTKLTTVQTTPNVVHEVVRTNQ
jgi:Transposase IS4